MRDCLPCRLSAGQRHTAAVEPDRVYFKSVWYDRKTRAIRDGLSSSRNWPLRGLKYYNEMMQARLPAFCSRWPQTRLLLCGVSLNSGEAVARKVASFSCVFDYLEAASSPGLIRELWYTTAASTVLW